MRPAPRFEIAACFLGGRSGVNFNLPFFNRNNGTVTITCKVHRQNSILWCYADCHKKLTIVQFFKITILRSRRNFFRSKLARGFQSQSFKGKYKQNLEFPGGVGKNKRKTKCKPSLSNDFIFLEFWKFITIKRFS